MEEWRPASGFDGIYEVSSEGRIRSLDRRILTGYGSTKAHRGRVLTPKADKDGYPRIVLRVDGTYYTRRVHRLVCEAFNGPPNILHCEVDHIDHDRANNRPENLRWVSHTENLERRPFPDGKRSNYAVLTEAQVRQIKSMTGQRAKAVAAEFGVSHWTIYSIWKLKRWGWVR